MLSNVKIRFADIMGSDRMTKIFKGIIALVTGNGLAMIIGFISSAILVRMVGLTIFGQVTLIVTYVTIIDSIVNFQSWQALVKFGSEHKDNPEKLQPYIKESFIIDLSTSILGTILAIAFAHIICGGFLGWDAQLVNLAKIYSFTILFHLEGMAIGYLRIIDKFKALSICTVVASVIKLIIIIIAYYIRRDIYVCVFVYALTDIVVYTSHFLVACYYLKKNRVLKGISKCKMVYFKDFFVFTTYTNIATTLDIPIKQLDVFIISKVLSVEAVAIQKIFNNLLNVFNKVSTPISQVVYPSFTRQIANNKIDECFADIKKISKTIFCVGIPCALLLGFSSPFWLKILYGTDVASYWVVFLVDALFRIFSMTFIAIHPLFTAMGLVKENIPIMLISNGIYFVMAIILGSLWGLYGMAIAYLIQLFIVVLLKYKYINKVQKNKE